MSYLEESCTFSILSEDVIKVSKSFDCNHSDLNDFFSSDCINYANELLGKIYCFRLNADPSTIVCAFTISNDSIKSNLLRTVGKRKFQNLYLEKNSLEVIQQY